MQNIELYIGNDVQGINIGDLLLCMAPHQSCQITNYKNVVKIPENVLPEHALFVRLAGVFIGVHEHKNIEEIYYLVSGKGILTYDGIEYEMTPGVMFHYVISVILMAFWLLRIQF